MNQESLESLLMDRAFGALPPETEQLLEAYLSEHPEHRDLARHIQQTADLARDAIAVEAPLELPPLAIKRSARPQNARPYDTGRWISIAAGLIIGVGIGLLSNLAYRKPDIQESPIAVAQRSNPMKTRCNGLDAAQAFWSTQTYSKQYEQRSLHNHDAIHSHKNTLMNPYRKRGLL